MPTRANARLIKDDFYCPHCNFNARNHEFGTPCPQCTRILSRETASPGEQAFTKDRRVVSTDYPCHNCGYNLRHLKYGLNCPECGTVIERCKSEHNHLMDSERPYLNRLLIGLGLLCLGITSPVSAIFILGMLKSQNPILIASVLGIGAISFLLGGWIITSPKPQESAIKRTWNNIAILTRVSLFASPAIVAACGVVLSSGSSNWISLIAMIAGLAEIGLLAAVLQGYAAWAQDDNLRTRFEYVTGGAIILGILALIQTATLQVSFTIGLIGILIVAVGGVWFILCVLNLFSIVSRAVMDKSQHDASVFRNPKKKLL